MFSAVFFFPQFVVPSSPSNNDNTWSNRCSFVLSLKEAWLGYVLDTFLLHDQIPDREWLQGKNLGFALAPCSSWQEGTAAGARGSRSHSLRHKGAGGDGCCALLTAFYLPFYLIKVHRMVLATCKKAFSWQCSHRQAYEDVCLLGDAKSLPVDSRDDCYSSQLSMASY